MAARSTGADLADKGTLSTVIWVVLIAIALLAALWKTEIFRKVVTFLSGVLLGMLVVSTVSLFVCISPCRKVQCQAVLGGYVFALSQEENILVVVSDTFESSYFARALEEDPSLKDDFKDFIYFTRHYRSFYLLQTCPCRFCLPERTLKSANTPSTAMIEAYASRTF